MAEQSTQTEIPDGTGDTGDTGDTGGAGTLARALAELAEQPARWRRLDVLGPDVRGVRATVLVGSAGVFVVRPAKAPRGRALDRLLGALDEAAATLARAAGVRRDEVHAVLCVSDDEHVDTWRHGVAVCGPGALLDNLLHRRERLGAEEVDDVARTLTRALNITGRHRRLVRGQPL